MKNQNKPENVPITGSRLSSKKKRKWKEPELIEENFRNTEQQPEFPDSPLQGNS